MAAEGGQLWRATAKQGTQVGPSSGAGMGSGGTSVARQATQLHPHSLPSTGRSFFPPAVDRVSQMCFPDSLTRLRTPGARRQDLNLGLLASFEILVFES